MISTPEIDKLTVERDKKRGEARRIESRLRDLRDAERARIRAQKRADRHEEARVQRDNIDSVMDEVRRLRVVVTELMAEKGSTKSEIRSVVGVSYQTVRLDRCRLERVGHDV